MFHRKRPKLWIDAMMLAKKLQYSRASMARTLMAHSPGLARTIIVVPTGHLMRNPPWIAVITLGVNSFSWFQACLSHCSSVVEDLNNINMLQSTTDHRARTPDIQNYAYIMKNLNNFQKPPASDFELFFHYSTFILHSSRT